LRAPTRTIPFTALLALLLMTQPAWAEGGLNLIPDWPTLALNLVVLGLLIYPVNRLLLQPLLAVILEREARTSGAIDRADGLVGEASAARESIDEGLLAARIEAQSRRAAVLGEAEQEERRILGEARAAANREIEGVRESIAGELTVARAALRDDARALAREAATRILGREL
jgi:F-type H+-transporting ATPase subunit b